MPNETRNWRAEQAPVLLSWGVPEGEVGEAPDVLAASLAGVGLLVLWTALAMLLTSA